MKTYEEGIAAGVEFCMTHSAHYNQEKQSDSIVKRQYFWIAIRPDRNKPGQLLPGSAEHRRQDIQIWQNAAIKALTE